MSWYVNEYETDRAYGGPEEGGWWYDTGRFVECHGTFPTEAAAEQRRQELAGYLRDRRAGRRGPGAVGSEGIWPVLVVEDAPGADYPAQRPVYA